MQWEARNHKKYSLRMAGRNSQAPTTLSAKQAEESSQGVKRKREGTTKEGPRRKKKKKEKRHSLSPISETEDESVVRAKKHHRAEVERQVRTPGNPFSQANGKVTPGRKRRKKSRSRVTLTAIDAEDGDVPSPDVEEDDLYSISRDEEASPVLGEEKLTPARKRRKKNRPRLIPTASDPEEGDIPDPDVEDDDIYSIGHDEEASPVLGKKKPPLHNAIKRDLVCHVCRRKFSNKKHLERHMANPRIHEKRHKCRICEKMFYQLADLRHHQNDADHKSKNAPRVGEARGAFTEKEKAKLNRFKQRFCDDYAVTEYEFNNLMTLMGRRKPEKDWPNPDVTISELRDMFYSVLPDRSRKSLNRYRERYFQNVEQDTTWTEEQVNELRELVEEKGSKWVEIAEILGRTQDSVYQKWKNRIRQGDAQRFDRWEEDEREALIVAVRECKRAVGLAQDFSSDDKINWTAVSDRLGRRRNAQQCSHFWRHVYRPREEAIAQGEKARPFRQGWNKLEPTKMRRESCRRSTRGTESVEVITPRRKVKSAPRITASDEEEASGQEDRVEHSRKKKSLRSERVAMASGNVEQLVQDNDDEQNEVPDPQQQSNGDPEEGINGNAVFETPSKKPKKKRLIDSMASSPAVLRDTPNLQRGTTRQSNSSLRTSNRQQQQSSVSPRRVKPKPSSISRISVVIPPPRAPKTPHLPSPPPTRTPRHVTSLSQAFDNTQAPTSAITTEKTTSGMHLIEEERPSPEIEMRLQPLRQERSEHSQPDENGVDQLPEQQQQQINESALPSQPDFKVYDSEAEHSDDGEPPQMFSSGDLLERLTDTLAEGQSQEELDTGASHSDNEEPPQMFSSDAPIYDGEDLAGAESDGDSEKENVEYQVAVDSEAAGTDDEPPPQIFRSDAPIDEENESAAAESDADSENEDIEQNDLVESETAGTDDEQPPQMFSSAAPEGSATFDTEESEPEEVDDDDNEPPQVYTSTLPGMEADESPGTESESESESEHDTEKEEDSVAIDDNGNDEDKSKPPQIHK
ncbi:MAG: hypothetical protein Q9172_004349 [Xanthocarpia lactea]